MAPKQAPGDRFVGSEEAEAVAADSEAPALEIDRTSPSQKKVLQVDEDKGALDDLIQVRIEEHDTAVDGEKMQPLQKDGASPDVVPVSQAKTETTEGKVAESFDSLASALHVTDMILHNVREQSKSYNDLVSHASSRNVRHDVEDHLCKPETVKRMMKSWSIQMENMEQVMIRLQKDVKEALDAKNKKFQRELEHVKFLENQVKTLTSAPTSKIFDLDLGEPVIRPDKSGGPTKEALLKLIDDHTLREKQLMAQVEALTEESQKHRKRSSVKRALTFSTSVTDDDVSTSSSKAKTGSTKSIPSVDLPENLPSRSESSKSGKSSKSMKSVAFDAYSSLSSISKNSRLKKARSAASIDSKQTSHDLGSKSAPIERSSTTKSKFESLFGDIAAFEFTDTVEIKSVLTQARTGQWGRLKHRVPFIQYMFFGIWIAMLFVGWRWQRLLCSMGLPNDCRNDEPWTVIMRDTEYMLLAGLVLAVLTGMNAKAKFFYVFDFFCREKDEDDNSIWHVPRGVVFVLAYLLTFPIWSALNHVPFLQSFSLSTDGVSGFEVVLVYLLIALVLFLLGWHLFIAAKYSEGCAFLAYVNSRAAVIGFYIAFMVVHANQAAKEMATFHLHHYVIGWLCATFAEFSHPLSMLLLAIGTAVFVQGTAAYGADSYISFGESRVSFEKLDGTTYYSPWVTQEAADWFTKECFGG